MNKILVTGAAGFIGSHASERFIKQKISVFGVDNFDEFYPRVQKENNLALLKSASLFSFKQLDFSKLSAHDLSDVNAVLHLAARPGVPGSFEAPAFYMDNNVTKTAVLLDLCRRCDVPMIFASSSSVYGNNTSPPFKETEAAAFPQSPYGASKRACELLAYSYYSVYSLPVTNLRFFTVYGPRIRPDLAIGKFIRKILAGQPISLFGDVSSYRDYTHSSDIVEGVFAAVTKQKKEYEVYNLASSKPVSLKDLIQKIEFACGKQAAVKHEPARKGDVFGTFGDVSHAAAKLGYSPQMPLEKGLKELVEWINAGN